MAFAVIVCLLCWRKAPVTPHSTHPLRVRNTDEPIASLARRDRALLLRNAVFDTTKPPTLDLPADLRATNGRVFIVQSDRPLDQRFYDALAQAGAKYISYIPYDAALVEASSNQVAALGSTFYVTPFEPYFKLASDLLQASVKHEPVTNALRIVTLPGSHDQALTQIQGFGWPLIGEDKTPMGPEFIVQVPGPNAAITAAQWPLAQEIELYRRRQPLNDLTRVRLGIATNTITRTNYYGLDGSAIWMNQNDTGADSTHPDLAGRIHLDPLTLTGDNDGHGTHVAGILIGNGSESTNIHGVPSGSVPGANFRGMAPKADLFVQSIDLVVGPLLSDEYLETNASFTLMQDSASQGGIVTNGFISNNSWGTGDLSYDIDAASFDAAVRDAQPLRSGEQAMTYVFAAGNSGDGTGNGLDNVQNTITSPGTAKNVITVGAIDSPRDITNQVSVD
ncbi:MAG TPA: S8 family serine peptidase, partial [Verrucomicrobiae bacterium]|nr:S8 family serine peptidase [Verrucomicrobiae bacterium]